jgi:hypothetical protein
LEKESQEPEVGLKVVSPRLSGPVVTGFTDQAVDQKTLPHNQA